MAKQFVVYILASGEHGTWYIGVTSDLVRRVYEHKLKVVPGFTKRYGIDKLVYFEVSDDAERAITREKQLKKWQKEWKIQLIEQHNPEWADLAPGLI